jgi:hypothetical protein
MQASGTDDEGGGVDLIVSLRTVVAVSCVVGVLAGCFSQKSEREGRDFLESDIKPHPRYTAEEVVEIQLKALRYNDESDRGIEITFRFASPSNRLETGPIERFVTMLKAPLYSPMLNHTSARFDPLQTDGKRAMQRVTLVSKDQLKIVYVFILSRQTVDPYVNCWMTDAVMIESVEKEKPPTTI